VQGAQREQSARRPPGWPRRATVGGPVQQHGGMLVDNRREGLPRWSRAGHPKERRGRPERSASGDGRAGRSFRLALAELALRGLEVGVLPEPGDLRVAGLRRAAWFAIRHGFSAPTAPQRPHAHRILPCLSGLRAPGCGHAVCFRARVGRQGSPGEA
jgi:hypothetical protein